MNGATPALGRPGISVVIIAQDEEPNIGDCLRSAGWADQVVVVDGGSRDRTAEIAASLGAEVHHNPWPGFSRQWDRAISLAVCDWVFMLAADERVTRSLAREVRSVAGYGSDRDGYYVPRQTNFLDRPMRGGGWDDQLELRFFRRGHGKMDGRLVHERVVVDGSLGRLEGKLLHDSHPTIADYLTNMNRCTSLEAQEAMAFCVRRSWLPPFGALSRATRRWLAGERSSQAARNALKEELKNKHEWVPFQPFAPLLRFLQMYLVQRGFRDGRHGLHLALLSAIYVYVKHVKLWELRTGAGEHRSIEVINGENATAGEKAAIHG